MTNDSFAQRGSYAAAFAVYRHSIAGNYTLYPSWWGNRPRLDARDRGVYRYFGRMDGAQSGRAGNDESSHVIFWGQ